MQKWVILAIIFLISVIPYTLADHGEDEQVNEMTDESINVSDITSIITSRTISAALIGTFLVLFFCILAGLLKEESESMKWTFFILIVIVTLGVTFYITASTLFLNSLSITKGPVHWHTDFQMFACGNKINLKDPTGFSNRIGTPIFHEHNDFRIHIEGVIINYHDVDLGNFFRVVGGQLTNEQIIIPTNDGELAFKNGDLCDGAPGSWQAFLIKTVNPDAPKGEMRYSQQKLENFENYIPAPHAYIPPGDCVILEFGPEKQRTKHICESYEAAERRGDILGS